MLQNEVRLIDANALPRKTVILRRRSYLDGRKYVSEIRNAVLAEDIDRAPTIDAVPVVHAWWVENHCTACGMMPMGDELWEHLDVAPPRMEFFMSYCPCCGAKMDGGATDVKG